MIHAEAKLLLLKSAFYRVKFEQQPLGHWSLQQHLPNAWEVQIVSIDVFYFGPAFSQAFINFVKTFDDGHRRQRLELTADLALYDMERLKSSLTCKNESFMRALLCFKIIELSLKSMTRAACLAALPRVVRSGMHESERAQVSMMTDSEDARFGKPEQEFSDGLWKVVFRPWRGSTTCSSQDAGTLEYGDIHSEDLYSWYSW